MGAFNTVTQLGNFLAGNTISDVAQKETAKHFKQGLGAAILVSLIVGFCGIAGYQLGMVFLYVFSLVYGWCAFKWLNTDEGAQQIDARMGTDREKEVAVAPYWNYFVYLITFGMIIVMLLPTALIQGPMGLWISVVLLMASPAHMYWRHRKAI
jgi:hypothetical protein